jgi:spore coat polysaccharide biosynthesis predicted glycosyltransferase SpsG
LKRKYNILICPLEWGLGHAGRMIPLAKKLQERQNSIFIGTGKEHQSMFRNELPGLTYIDFQGFKPGYSRFLPQYIVMLMKTPVLLYHIISEHIRLKRIIQDHDIDIVISDNRFGLWNRNIKSVYVTHQPIIPLPPKLKYFEWIGVLFHRFFIRKYSLCFIPDLPGELNVSGRMTHTVKLPENTRFIGILSRFPAKFSSHDNKTGFPHNTLILSGPEPQRGIFRQKIVEIMKDRELPIVVLEGKPGNPSEVTRIGNIISYNHLPANEMENIILGSKCIIARSGYTSIMELISLNCNALLVPTPGQTEQEYLAAYLSAKGWFSTVSQKNLNAGLSLPAKKASWTGEIIDESRKLVEKALNELLDQ